MSQPSIYVSLSTFAEHDRAPLAALEASGVPFTLNTTGRRVEPGQLIEQGRTAAVIIAGVERYDAQTLAALPHLRCISRCGVGVDAIDLEIARARGIAVANTPDPPVNAVAELALTMMLALSRNLPRQAVAARAGGWARLEAHLLGARRVGIVGLGRIGRRVAALAQAFGSEVWGADPQPDAAWAAAQGVRVVPLDELLAACEIVSIHASGAGPVPLTLDAAEVGRMRPGAILINLGRGGMVDEDALSEALRSGHLFGAGLDVYRQEPYDGPLCTLDNVILTPHAATLTVETRSAMERQCVEQSLAFLRGTLPPAARVI